MAGTILAAAARQGVDAWREQADYALSLVCSGRVARECGVQRALIDALVDAGADPGGPMLPAVAHKEVDAAERLLERGAPLTLTAAIGTGREGEVERLASAADAGERRLVLIAAALYGRSVALRRVIERGVDVNVFGPPGFHAHATALHHAVDAGSLAAVKVLVEAGARLDTRDLVRGGTPLDWAEYLQQAAIAEYLRGRRGER